MFVDYSTLYTIENAMSGTTYWRLQKAWTEGNEMKPHHKLLIFATIQFMVKSMDMETYLDSNPVIFFISNKIIAKSNKIKKSSWSIHGVWYLGLQRTRE